MAITTAQDFIDAAAKRRSVYTINNSSPLSESEIESIVRQAVENCPSPWNVSSSRVLILFGDKHRKVFNEVVYPQLEGIMPPPVFDQYGPRVRAFAGGFGSCFFFEDQEAIEGLKQKQPMAAPMADEWSDVSSGMVQFTVWAALSLADLGCSLQHFSSLPGLISTIQKDFDVPAQWKLKAQLVFGSKTAEPGEKAFAPSRPIDERIKVAA